MKISQINNFEGQCISSNFIKGDLKDELNCLICYEIMTKPITLDCPGRHVFGMNCFKAWAVKNTKVPCPYCRATVLNYQINQSLAKMISSLEAKCIYCQEWKGCPSKLQTHYQNCENYYFFLGKKLAACVQEEKLELNRQINPHLKQKHQQIYNKYVNDWEWLGSDFRDWKWWWWCSNPWWENKSCPTCNNLWHKYEKKIDLIELKRVEILNQMNKFSLFEVRDLYEEK